MDYASVAAALPLVLLLTLSLTMLVLDLFGLCRSRLLWVLTACVASWAFSLPQFFLQEKVFYGMIAVDPFGAVFSTIILGGVACAALLNHKHLRAQHAESGVEVDMLMLFSALGAMVMVNASHFLTLFLGFELLSLCVYVLAGVARKERASSEGALKYFILGAFSSAFLLYGMALTYGAVGSMEFSQVAAAISLENELLLLGLGLLIFGFGFKLSLVPFHVWTPDVYQGAPVSITGFMAVVVKAAAFGSFIRLLFVGFAPLGGTWSALLWVLSLCSMTAGNLLALRQTSVKRMLAYSSIAHAGYALIGLVVMGSVSSASSVRAFGAESALFYLIVYSLMTIAAFGVVLLATAGSSAQYERDDIKSLSGLGWTHPFLGLVMTIAILSLAGFPPLAGFIGKFYLFNAAVSSGFVGLAIIGALNSVVALYYYLRVIVQMYFAEAEEGAWSPALVHPLPSTLALAFVTFGVIYLGLFSEGCFFVLEAAIRSLG